MQTCVDRGNFERTFVTARTDADVTGAGASGHGETTEKVVAAACGIEAALWDLAGNLFDLPATAPRLEIPRRGPDLP